ncbi:MAG: metal ABC transporter substrate-binding protein [Peptococcaceae bacterium]|nr:metal ABC transporter substrate-binding protein [Peptococcaceae bacterium]
MAKPTKHAVIVLLVFFLFLAAAGCSKSIEKDKPANSEPDSRKIKVFTTIYPLYDFTKNICREKAEVHLLVPPGSEPHDWEPTPKEFAELQNADVFIYTGAGMESWADNVLKAISAPKLVIVNASQNIDLIGGSDKKKSGDDVEHAGQGHEQNKDEGEEYEAKGKQEGEHEHDHDAGTDPHVWVDPVNAMKIVENITAGIVKADPANKVFYEANSEDYRKKLQALHEDYMNGLAKAAKKEFITSHASFGYLARRYGLIQVPVRGLSPDVEPTPARLTEILKLVREKQIRYIFYESLVSPKVSQTIANEAGVGTLVLNPAGGLTPEEIKAGKDYLSVMRENLVNLQKALEVKS